MATLLAKRPNATVVAKDDTHYDTMAADPTLPIVKEGSTWNDNYTSEQSVTETNNSSQFSNVSSGPAPILTGAQSTNAASGAEVLVANTNEHWINSKWRPFMGWMYTGVCVADFVIFPVLWSILQAVYNGKVDSQWQPLTLQGAGLFHIAMGAILGIAAYGRTKEKIETSKV